MKLSTILWPWGRLLEMERELATLERDLAVAASDYRFLGRRLDDTRARAEMYQNALTRAAADGLALTRELQSAHFRNPATGRLGRKGERFNTGTL